MFLTVKQAAEKWNISERRVRALCSKHRIPGAYKAGRSWLIPVDAAKPADARYKSTESLLEMIDRKKHELDNKRPLTEGGETERLREEFIVEYAYNSNAIEGNTLTLRETDLVLKGLTIGGKPLKDHLEAIGQKEAFGFISELVKEKKPMSEEMIKQVHYLVLADQKLIGVYTAGCLCALWGLNMNLYNHILFSPKWNSYWRILLKIRKIL